MARPRGRDPKKTPNITVGFAVDEEMRDRLHTVANSSGMTVSKWLRDLVADAITDFEKTGVSAPSANQDE